jgi:hopanoid biosynthesis associated RND transporter like protein HpnN
MGSTGTPNLLNSALAGIVDVSFRRAVVVIVIAGLVALSAGSYAARRFAINTNIDSLISSKLSWRQRELAYEKAFPESTQSILAVVTGPTPELANAAARALEGELAEGSDRFQSVTALNAGDFFERHSLLYLAPDDLKATSEKLEQAAPLIGVLASDPTLRGLTQALSMALGGVQAERYSLDEMRPTLDAVSDTVEQGLAGRPASFSWKRLLAGTDGSDNDKLRLIEIWAKLDFGAIEPGRQAADAIRAAAERARLTEDFGAQLRLTGPVPLADGEFASLREGAFSNGVITAVLVLVILWLALGSWRLVLAVAITLGAGLAVAAGLGLFLVGALNPISVAFAVLFVGLGADFAIQFSVRYRARRHELADLHPAVVTGAQWIGAPLLLAALSAAAGFFSFMPTSYSGWPSLD